MPNAEQSARLSAQSFLAGTIRERARVMYLLDKAGMTLAELNREMQGATYEDAACPECGSRFFT